MTTTNTYGRQVTEALVNKSGGGVVAGDVVVIDTANDGAFTTTTTGQAQITLGIVQETIAANATGRVLLSGFAALVNVPSSVTRGHFLQTHTVAKQAVGNATRQAGSFGQFRTGGTTPTAVIWGFPDGAGGSGAPTTAKYIAAAADGGLSAEIVIPGLAGNADVKAGGAADDEFDTTAAGVPSGWAAYGSLSTIDANTTALSHLYLVAAADASSSVANGIYKAAPSMPFTMTAKLAELIATANFNSAGIAISTASPASGSIFKMGVTCGAVTTGLVAFEDSSGGANGYGGSARPPVYLRIVVTSSSNVAAYWSYNGRLWVPLHTGVNPGFTVGSVILFARPQNGSTGCQALFDWVRFT